MRKDVKFGLTIGAILICTLVVYLIVLMQGGGSTTTPGGGVALNPPAANDSGTPTPTESQPQSDETTSPTANANSTASESPATSTQKPTDATSQLEVAPTTKPSGNSSEANADWNNLLDHGNNTRLLAIAPQRTETPIIDKSTDRYPTTITPDGQPATIDNLPNLPAQNTNNGVNSAMTLFAMSGPTTRPVTDTFATARPPSISAADPSGVTPNTALATQRTHVIARGENLWSIAVAAYGNGKYVNKIIQANPGLDPKHLRVGKVLTIPELNAVERSVPMMGAAAAAPVAVNSAEAYRVVSGDSLEAIAQKLYGDPRMMDKIYALNKPLIGADENRLKVGWVLKLPAPPTAR